MTMAHTLKAAMTENLLEQLGPVVWVGLHSEERRTHRVRATTGMNEWEQVEICLDGEVPHTWTDAPSGVTGLGIYPAEDAVEPLVVNGALGPVYEGDTVKLTNSVLTLFVS